jgi:hypothetical protein
LSNKETETETEVPQDNTFEPPISLSSPPSQLSKPITHATSSNFTCSLLLVTNNAASAASGGTTNMGYGSLDGFWMIQGKSDCWLEHTKVFHDFFIVVLKQNY